MPDDGTWRTVANISERERYQRYLASREWAVLKRLVHARSEGLCERCKANIADQVHHMTYIRKYREQLDDLLHVCRKCHEFVSGKSDLDPAEHDTPPYPGDLDIGNRSPHPNHAYYRQAWRDLWFCYRDIDRCLDWWRDKDSFPIEEYKSLFFEKQFRIYGGDDDTSVSRVAE